MKTESSASECYNKNFIIYSLLKHIPCTSFIGANCITSLEGTLPVELSSLPPLFGSRNCTVEI